MTTPRNSMRPVVPAATVTDSSGPPVPERAVPAEAALADLVGVAERMLDEARRGYDQAAKRRWKKREARYLGQLYVLNELLGAHNRMTTVRAAGGNGKLIEHGGPLAPAVTGGSNPP